MIRLSPLVLWLLPLIQLGLLLFFWGDAAFLFWIDWSLLIPAWVVGLLGGSVYVGVFSWISEDTPDMSLRQFRLSSASAADSLGIVLANIVGVAIQRQLYALHGIQS